MANVCSKFRLAGFTVLAAGLMLGCNTIRRNADDVAVRAADAPSATCSPVTIVYRTKTDRLNLVGADLPPCSMATLRVQTPHPRDHDKSDFGYAQLMVLPCSVDAELTPQALPAGADEAAVVWE